MGLVKNKLFISAAVSVLIALIIEIFAFNIDWFSQDSELYGNKVIELPFNEDINGKGVVLDSNNAQVTLNDIGMRVANIKVTASGPKQIIKGSIYTTGLSNVYSPAYVQSFSFVPGGDLNFFQARIERFGETNSLIIKFDTKFYGNIIVTGIELNAHNDFNFSIFRFLALFAISFLVISAFIFKLYKVDYDESKPLHKLAFAGSLLLCLSYSVFWLYYTHPSNTVPWVWRYVSGSTIQLSTPDHSLLYDLPHSKEEISEADIYPQLLDAFNKGQFNIDVFVDPRMMTLDNPWDSSERVAKGIRYYHERTFYNGKYYIYYGLAPLFTVYYPVYWLTGKLPTPMLVAFILSFLSVCMIFLAVRSLVKFFKVQPNILLLCLGSIAITSGSLIFAIQSSTLFYGYLTQSWVIWFCFLVVMLTEACSRCLCGSGKTIRRIMLALCGVSIFMMVQSRPASLIYGLIFATPFLWKILREKSIDNRDKIFDFASIGFTTLLGALFSMWYNYARFDSVFEFGIFYNVSSDFRHNFSSISPHSIAVCLYYYFLEPFVYSIEFPFVEMSKSFPSNYFGTNMYFGSHGGIFNIPLCLCLLLSLVVLLKKNFVFNADKTLGVLSCGLILIQPIMACIINFSSATVETRYCVEFLVFANMLALIWLVQIAKFKKGNLLSLIAYVLAVYLIVKTAFIGGLLAFTPDHLDIKNFNPDLFLSISRMIGLL